MNTPTVSILFITFNRIELLTKTYNYFISNTEYPREKLELILCDDGSPKSIQEEMRKLTFDKYLFAKKNEGMAANVNKGIIAASGEFILQLQDDWICNGPKDYLLLGIKALDANNDLGIIRYRLGIHYPNFSIRELANKLNKINILEWDQGVMNITQFIYSDNPHLKKKSLHQKIGLYKSFSKMSQTEIEFCERFNKLKLFNVGFIEGYSEVFQHIGENHSLRRNYKIEAIKDFFAKSVLTRKFYAGLKRYKTSLIKSFRL